jgi:carboxyl-terminal processing protease
MPKPRNDQRHTDTGRTVYGGGGIEPDIKVEPPEVSSTQSTIWTTGLFMFTREMIAGRIPAASSFKRSSPEFEHQPQAGEFVISDAIMKAYRDFMVDFVAKNQDLGLTMEIVDENLEWARTKIREEVLIAAYGVDMQKRIMAEQDVQLQRGITEIPQSAQLADRARRMVRTSKR